MAVLELLFWLAVIAVVGIVGVVLYCTFRVWQHKRYFKERGVPFLPVNLDRLLLLLMGKLSFFDIEMKRYEEALATGRPFVGYSDAFNSPAFYIVDLDLIRNIYVKDFEYFVNRRKFAARNNDILFKRMLISHDDEHWKGLRSKLSPTFTSGKIRRMFKIFDTSSQKMCEYLRKNLGPSGDYDICEVYSKYALDVIASCAFAIDSKSFECEPGTFSEFERMAQKMQFRFTPLEFMKLLLCMAAPKIADFIGIQPFAITPQIYFLKVIKGVMKNRRETGERQSDFLQLMMDAQDGLLKDEENSKESLEVMTGIDIDNMSGFTSSPNNPFTENRSSAKFRLEDDDIVANCVLFLIGGFDTTQSLLIYAAYQLALEPEVQQKLLEEVKASMDENDGKLTYDGVLEMNYMDMFINETLRYFPPAPMTERICTKDYKIPGTDVVIKKGQLVGMPVLGIHHEPKHYPDPEKFDPERFSPKRKKERHPYAFTPFGHGPRNCIGMRFALMEVKTVIATLVHDFKLEPCGRTEIPPKFGNSTSLKPLNGMWLKITSRSTKKMFCN